MKYLVHETTKQHVLWQQGMPSSAPGYYTVGADSEGWIKHDGGECPLPDGCAFDAQYRDGDRTIGITSPSDVRWSHESGGWCGDIMFYRPILDDKPEDIMARAAKKYADISNEITYQAIWDKFGPKQQRNDLIDRLRASHKAASELPDIIAELREVLEPMGLVVMYASEMAIAECGEELEKWDKANPELDMTDWRNWREGDKMEIIQIDGYDSVAGVDVGDIVTILEDENRVPFCRTTTGGVRALRHQKLRFHSRPTKEQDK